MKPRLKMSLFKHQEVARDFALSHPYHICGLEMGLGKSATALAAACVVGGKTLAVVPAFLRRNWKEEIEKFTEGLDITVIGYSELKKFLATSKERYQFVIADEAHYLKNHKAQRTELFHGLVESWKPTHLMLMSGTPIKNRVSEYWSLLQLCYYGRHFSDFEPFDRMFYKFCNTFSYERSFEVNGFPIVRFDGVKNVEYLKTLIKPVYIRQRAKDVLDLPETIDTNIMSKNSTKFDADLQKAYELFQLNEKDPAYMSIKAANALAKISDTIQLVEDMLAQDRKVVVFTCHRESAKQLAERFKVKAITGQVDSDDRHMIISEFNLAPAGVLVATIGAASVGFNLTSANYMVFNDFPFVPADLEQARKRIHRIGAKSTCFYYYMFTSEFDKDLFDMINRKTRDIEKVVEV